jgi:hypothetical protein
VVSITGTGFTGTTGVTFYNLAATSFTVVSSTSIKAVAPIGVANGVLTVTTPGGTAYSSSSFTAAPTITSFTPANGGFGTLVTIVGTGFTGATAVYFNGNPAGSFTVSDTSIAAQAPLGVTTGPISVTTPAGTATSPTSFNTTPAPTITGFTPTSGGAGTIVTLAGTNFTGTTAVAFNGMGAFRYSVQSATSITAEAGRTHD